MSVLFNFQITEDMPVFFPVLASSLIIFWPETLLHMICIFLNVLTSYDLHLLKCVDSREYAAVLGWHVLPMIARSNWA